jgi:putative N-acetylmannosamine-6-phosphate epimerase
MDRIIKYLENGVEKGWHLSGYTSREIKEKTKDLQIIKILKPFTCKHCKGEGYIWKSERT